MEINNIEFSNMQVLLVLYIIKQHPEKIKYNPKVFYVDDKYIRFGMSKHYGTLRLSKSAITDALTCLN